MISHKEAADDYYQLLSKIPDMALVDQRNNDGQVL